VRPLWAAADTFKKLIPERKGGFSCTEALVAMASAAVAVAAVDLVTAEAAVSAVDLP
jgi:hypothetical protein